MSSSAPALRSPSAGHGYAERPPVAALAGLVSSTWTQWIASDAPPYLHRSIPTGGVELRCGLGSVPQVAGPLTRARVESLAPGGTVVGLRFHPGAAATVLGVPAAELTDRVVDADTLWGADVATVGARMAEASSPEQAGVILQGLVAGRLADATRPDPVVTEAVRRLMPWRAEDVASVRSALAVSERSFRRRCWATIGVGPKALQLILRFQGVLARAQYAVSGGRPAGGDGLALLAAASGYADQAHLTRECVRLPVAPRSGGHSFAGRSSTDGIVVDVSPMSAVDVVDGAVTVGAGARLGDLYATLDAQGLTIPAGCGPDVGIAGLTLGGGLGVLGRTHGLTSDRLLGARVVLADGQVVDCDARHHADLFWALRGAGGGNFGVATSLTFASVPAPHVTTFHHVWAHEHAVRVVDAWQRWSPETPDRLAASLLVTAAADVARPPVLNVFGMLAGGEPEAANLLGMLTDLVGVAPVSAVAAPASYAEAKRYLAELGERMPGAAFEHGHNFSKSEFFDAPLPDGAVEALVRNLDRARYSGQARELDFTPWGGAYTRVPVDATAFPHRTARFLLKHAVVIHADASRRDREAARAWLRRSWGIVHPWGTGGVYPNFSDPDLTSWARAYHGPNLERLRQVKAAYDPDGFFRFPQAIPAPSERARQS